MKIFFIAFLLVNFSQFTYSQSKIIFQADYVLAYSLVHSPDSNNLNDKDYIEFFLFGNSDTSYWVEKGKYLYDSAVSKISEKPTDGIQVMQIYNSLPKAKSLATIDKLYKQNTIKHNDHIRRDNFFYVEPLNAIIWKLGIKKQVIGGFNCQSATCKYKGRQYEAWFTTDVGINEGPYKFYGLPGMIVKINDTDNHVQYELLTVRKVNLDIPMLDWSKNPGATKISSGEFKQMKVDAIKNPLVGIENSGIVMDEENQKKVMERAKIRSARLNNPIELED